MWILFTSFRILFNSFSCVCRVNGGKGRVCSQVVTTLGKAVTRLGSVVTKYTQNGYGYSCNHVTAEGGRIVKVNRNALIFNKLQNHQYLRATKRLHGYNCNRNRFFLKFEEIIRKRREQDSNLRTSFAGYTLSRRASSTTRAPLLAICGCKGNKKSGEWRVKSEEFAPAIVDLTFFLI